MNKYILNLKSLQTSFTKDIAKLKESLKRKKTFGKNLPLDFKKTEDPLPAPTDGKIFLSFVLNMMFPD